MFKVGDWVIVALGRHYELAEVRSTFVNHEGKVHYVIERTGDLTVIPERAAIRAATKWELQHATS